MGATVADSASILAGKEQWENVATHRRQLPDLLLIRAIVRTATLTMAAISNTSASPVRPSSPRSRFHGLSEQQGQQIASYIRSLPVPSPGRPWNPPYQPGPGLDAQPVVNWAAGAGLAWVLDNDSGTLPFLFGSNMDRAIPHPQGAAAKELEWSALVPRITREPFRPDGNLNPREIPICYSCRTGTIGSPRCILWTRGAQVFRKVNSPNGTAQSATLRRPAEKRLPADPNRLCEVFWHHRILRHRFRPAASYDIFRQVAGERGGHF